MAAPEPRIGAPAGRGVATGPAGRWHPRVVSAACGRAGWALMFEDQPVLAWGEFKRPEAALHLPVACRLEFFHSHASLIMGEAADALDAALVALLRPESGPGSVVASVPSISRRSPTAAGPTP